VLASLAVALGASAQVPSLGAKLAEHWCMGCHDVEAELPMSSSDRIPSFSKIAARPTTTADSLANYLSTAHTHMPDFAMTKEEREALVSYILDLRQIAPPIRR